MYLLPQDILQVINLGLKDITLGTGPQRLHCTFIFCMLKTDLPSAGSYVVYCNATMSGTPTSGVSNLGIQVNGVDGTGMFHSVGSCSHNGFAIDLNGFFVVTTNAANDKIRLRLYQNGGYTETWKNLQIRYKKIL